MTDFPRGWTFTSDVVGGTASITVPAIAGVAHVLDSISATLASANPAGTGFTVTITSSDGTYAAATLARLTVPTAAAGSLETAEASRSDLGLAAGAGASLTVAFSGGGANFTETLVIQGHDI